MFDVNDFLRVIYLDSAIAEPYIHAANSTMQFNYL